MYKTLHLAVALSLAVANAVGAQTITSPNIPVAVTPADEFATRVLQDSWDMNQRTDLGWFTFGSDQPHSNLTGMQFSGGIFSATPGAPDAADPNFWLLDPPTYGRVRFGKDGQTFPIDAGKYKRLLVRMNFTTGASGVTGQILWNVTKPEPSFGEEVFPAGTQGWRVYVVDLNADPDWAGMVDSLRVDPANITIPGQIQVDWARLVDTSQGSQTISWTGGDSYDIFISDTAGCGRNISKVGLNQSGGSMNLYAAGLPPGSWYVGMAPASASAPTVCSTGYFQVSAAPTVAFTSPSEEGSSDDFATAQLGNPWDLQALNDVDHFRRITGLGITSIQAQTEAGGNIGPINVLSGTSAAGDGSTGYATCSDGTFPVGDPHVYPLWYQPGAEGAAAGRGLTTRIDTNRYRILTFEQAIPRARDLCHGSVARVVWKVAGEPKENVTSDILLHHGPSTMVPVNGSSGEVMQKITLDMADRTKVPLESNPSVSTSGWVNGSASNPGLDIFRIDFHEFGNPTAFYLRRVKLAALEQADTSFPLSVSVTDPTGTVSFFDDADGAGFDGAAISGCTGLSAAATTSCTWTTTGLTHNTLHYPYAVVSVGGTVVNQAYARWPVKIHHPGDVVPTLTVDYTTLLFNSVVGTATTPAQSVTVGQVGSGTMPWTASSNVPWLLVSPASGTGAGLVNIQLSPAHPAAQTVGTVHGTVTLVALGSNTRTIAVTLSVVPSGASSPPFGQVDTPINNATGVQGTIGVTGWALDDMGVSNVKIYRNCLAGDGACQSIGGYSVVYIGDAAFVPGARPDLEKDFPIYPQNYRGGWGYLMLTNMLPNVTGNLGFGGQGPLTIYAFATDLEGRRTLLGRTWTGPLSTAPTSITLANATIAKPFGAIDTPGQGQIVSGLLPNFGWALTPDSNTVAGDSDIFIPTNGSTMQVVIDGAAVATVGYNQCRFGNNPVLPGTYCEDDVANIFGNPTPKSIGDSRSSNATLFRNLDAGQAAIGAHEINTTLLTNGRHSIAWGVTDSAGRVEGIGSRDFVVLNGSSLMAARMASAMADAAAVVAIGRTADLDDRSMSETEVWGRTGFDFTRGTELVAPNADGVRHVKMPELGRLELWLGEGVTAGYIKANADLRPLPPGSQLDTSTGRFTWGPLVGYIGPYDLVFVNGDGQLPVHVTLEPKSSETAGLMRGYIDQPADRATVAGTFAIGGWAIDLGAWQGSGVGAVHVWARNIGALMGSSVFLGSAEIGVARPDVAAGFGIQGERSGWHVPSATLPPGTYEVTAYFWSTRTGRFEDARTTSVTVR